jgi:ABC-type uncharacterized transport system substrate-binding protein
MKKKFLVSLLAASMLSSVYPARAQQPTKIPRIGILTSGSAANYHTPVTEAFHQALRELGYVEGKNILMEYRFADGRSERLPELAEELVRMNVDVIVTTATDPTLAAQRATRTIPIVMVSPGDPVGAGLVASLARPGGNVTGIATTTVDFIWKRLELLKEITPKISRVAVLWIPTNTGNQLQMKETEVAADSLRLPLQPAAVQGPNDFESAFSAMATGGASCLTVLGSLYS